MLKEHVNTRNTVFTYGLLTGTLNNSACTAKWQELKKAYNELERIWKQMVMAWFEVLAWHLPGEMEEFHENYKKSAVRVASFFTKANPGTPKYETGVLPIQPQRSEKDLQNMKIQSNIY